LDAAPPEQTRNEIADGMVFGGQNIAVKKGRQPDLAVSFMDYDLGFFDHETCRLESACNPFTARVLPMSV
jgi:putative transposase